MEDYFEDLDFNKDNNSEKLTITSLAEHFEDELSSIYKEQVALRTLIVKTHEDVTEFIQKSNTEKQQLIEYMTQTINTVNDELVKIRELISQNQTVNTVTLEQSATVLNESVVLASNLVNKLSSVTEIKDEKNGGVGWLQSLKKR